MGKLYRLLMMLFVVLIVIGFFLPWVNIESKQVGSVTKLLTGKRQEIIHSISGFDIPTMANSEDARLIISIAKIIKPDIQGVDKKSYLVWSVPILALMILLLVFLWGKNRWLSLLYGIIGLAIFFIAVFKIKTTDLDKLVLQVRIAHGLWLILWSYLAIGIMAMGNFRLIAAKTK